MSGSLDPTGRAGSNPRGDSDRFDPRKLDRSVVAIPLLDDLDRGFARTDPEWAAKMARLAAGERVAADPAATFDVIIDLNLDHSGGIGAAMARVEQMLDSLAGASPAPIARRRTSRYIFAALTRTQILDLILLDRPDPQATGVPIGRGHFAIYKVWPDFPVQALLTRSVATVKADAARRAFDAQGKGIVWAVLDSGVSQDHVHFRKWNTLSVVAPLTHQDFVVGDTYQDPLRDDFGHGTHVAGIIAGEYDEAWCRAQAAPEPVVRQRLQMRDERNQESVSEAPLPAISGVAPCATILSLRVLDSRGSGMVSALIAALEYVQELNQDGRRLLVHGVNLSVGYEFDPEWFACGQSPLCVEVNRLVRMGCVVVVAAGNTGYGKVTAYGNTTRRAGLDLTINDPGNADLAITVGSTHREEPHTYGVSFFSSKGPTGDGRAKPDLVAPGERVISCGAGIELAPVAIAGAAPVAAALVAAGAAPAAPSAPAPPSALPGLPPVGVEVAVAPPAASSPQSGPVQYYIERSGTSMACPHVSGVVAAFLSIRREFIGEPEKVKQIFLDSATDLKRDPYFQGRGLVDLMRAIQSV